MNNFEGSIITKLPHTGTSIFAVMSQLANAHNAVNLSQGFPDFPISDELIKLVNKNMKNGNNQYAPMPGVPQLRKNISDMFKKNHNADYDPDKNATADGSLDDSFFTILVDRSGNQLVVEHYTNDKVLTKRIVGKTAEALLGTIVKLGLVKSLYHSGYLGKELKKAEIALKTGRDYEQDTELKF